MEEKRIQSYDSMHNDQVENVRVIMRYLQDEWRDKKPGVEEPDWDKWNLVFNDPQTPRQRKNVDCGLFASLIANFISIGLPLSFSQDHVNANTREKFALSILKNCLIYK